MKSNCLAKICIVLLLTSFVQRARGQVIISLLLGDKLNSGKVEFGLDGGVNFISQSGVGSSMSAFNLGFYFDIKMKGSWMIHTGVIVKSTMGASNLPTYRLNIADLDSIFAQGSVDRTMQYFHVPVFLKHTFRNHFYVEGGLQLGLLYKANDKFRKIVNGQELSYNVDVLDAYHRLDAGLAAGIGYRLMGGNGMNLGVRYYGGFVNIAKEAQQTIMNQSLYITVGIPIGAGKARAREKE